jgi:hypothetical protein
MKTTVFSIGMAALAFAGCGGGANGDERIAGTRAELSCEWAGQAIDVCAMGLDPETAVALDDISRLTTLARELDADLRDQCAKGLLELGVGRMEESPCERFAEALTNAVASVGGGRMEVRVAEPTCQLAPLPSCGAHSERLAPVCSEAQASVFLADDPTEAEQRAALALEKYYGPFLLANRTIASMAGVIESAHDRLGNVPQPCLSTAEAALDDARLRLADQIERTRSIVVLLTDPL